jgi:hypothetical protein
MKWPKNWQIISISDNKFKKLEKWNFNYETKKIILIILKFGSPPNEYSKKPRKKIN